LSDKKKGKKELPDLKQIAMGTSSSKLKSLNRVVANRVDGTRLEQVKDPKSTTTTPFYG
jgi:hypothetical protein